MGANIDEAIVELNGKQPMEAFRDLAERRAYDYGHAGYTGTLAEKRTRGMTVVATCQTGTVADLRLLSRVVQDDRWFDDEPFDPRKDDPAVEEVMGRFALSLGALRNAADAFDNKWGVAIGFATATHLWVGGWCSS